MKLVGVDLKAPAFGGGTWIVRSVMEVEAGELLAAVGPPALFVSDMAPNTSGNRFTDHMRQIGLARRALELAEACLKPEGAFVAKVFDGEEANDFVREVESKFAEVKRVKPEATRDRSVEFFVVGRGFRGPVPRSEGAAGPG
jgi:23S rRNA (uridine2552-2'-O)-methyltransferase